MFSSNEPTWYLNEWLIRNDQYYKQSKNCALDKSWKLKTANKNSLGIPLIVCTLPSLLKNDLTFSYMVLLIYSGGMRKTKKVCSLRLTYFNFRMNLFIKRKSTQEKEKSMPFLLKKTFFYNTFLDFHRFFFSRKDSIFDSHTLRLPQILFTWSFV